MSGQPYKYASDVEDFRRDYMAALGMRANLDDANLQANKQFKDTGSLPPQSTIKDTRTTPEILADTEKLKLNLIAELKSMGILNSAVLNAMMSTPRELFISSDNLNEAYENRPLNIDGVREEPNGAFVETILDVVLKRIEYYQDSKFKCRENALAITKIEEALHWLNARTERRIKEGTEGTHNGK